MNLWTWFFAPALAALAIVTAPANAQQPQDRPLSDAEKSAVVQAAAKDIEANYWKRDLGGRIASELRAAARAGAFNGPGGALALTDTMGTRLAAYGDKHLGFAYGYEPSDELGPTSQSAEAYAEEVSEAKRYNYNVTRIEWLGGNVGLLKIDAMPHPRYAGEAWARAMAALETTDALIIDLRENGGGAPEMVAFLASWFFEGEPIHLFNVIPRDEADTRQYWTNAWTPGPRYADKPVYILTSRSTFSGAEALAYHLQARKRAVVVGETTRGGAHPVLWWRVHPNFLVKIPVARTLDAQTGANWEGTGVRPDKATKAEAAMDTAYREVLDQLIARATTPRDRRVLGHYRDEVDRKLQRATPAPVQ